MAPAEIHTNSSFIYNFPFPVVVSVTLVVLFSVYKNCAEIYQFGIKINGVYKINPDGLGEFEVYCDQKTAGGGWTVFQKRQDGSVDFYRPWDDYKRGFGNLNGEFWLGLDKIYRLTVSGSYKLRVDLEDVPGKTAFAEYSSFAVTSERTKYRLSLGSYSGTSFYDISVCDSPPKISNMKKAPRIRSSTIRPFLFFLPTKALVPRLHAASSPDQFPLFE